MVTTGIVSPVESGEDQGEQRGEPAETPDSQGKYTAWGCQAQQVGQGDNSDDKGSCDQDLLPVGETLFSEVVGDEVVFEHGSQAQKLTVE